MHDEQCRVLMEAVMKAAMHGQNFLCVEFAHVGGKDWVHI